MKLEVEILDDGIKQVRLTGRLDIPGTGEIEDAFVIQTVTEKAAVLVDLTGVDFVASFGMRMLLENAKALTRRGGKMALYNPQPMVEDVLKTAGIDELIPIYKEFEAACAALKSAVS